MFSGSRGRQSSGFEAARISVIGRAGGLGKSAALAPFAGTTPGSVNPLVLAALQGASLKSRSDVVRVYGELIRRGYPVVTFNHFTTPRWFAARGAGDFYWWTDAQTQPTGFNQHLLQQGFDAGFFERTLPDPRSGIRKAEELFRIQAGRVPGGGRRVVGGRGAGGAAGDQRL